MNYQNNQDYRYDSNKVLKNNSRRILYVTVIVAALFVAVISGTFAYFQASVTSPANSVTGNIYDVNSLSSMTVTKMNGTASNGDKLIPLDTDNNYDATNGTLNGTTTGAAMINVALQNNCIDSNGYTACHVFKIDVVATANGPRIPISGTIDITGTKVTNLKYTIISARSTTNASSISQLSMADAYYTGAATISSTSASLTFTSIDASNNNYLPANTQHNYYYLIVWLEDTASDQTTANAGGSYTGTVTVNAVNGTNQKITATFSSGA